MKKVTRVLVSITCLVLLAVLTTGCADKVDKNAIRQEQVRIAEYTIQHFENIKKIEFKDFEKNPSTGTWSSHAVINNEIHITYRVNDLSGKSEIGIDSHISASNGKKIKRKNNNDGNESSNSKDTVEVHYWEG
jgi:hypothetical protein